jgi:hypothetical protein
VTDINRPLLGEPNAPCRTCGAPLAADQRYCLQCGERRAEARLPFLDILARQAGAAAPAPPPPPAPRGRLAGLSTNAAAVAGVAVLLLALGVGVLIGGIGGTSDSAAGNAAPQIITVNGGAAAAPTTAAPADTGTAPDAGAGATPKSRKSSKSSKQDSASSSSGSKATNNAVKNLDKTSGGDYAKKSAKLPKTLGTGGKAPPVDKSGTKIGGGTGVESIG